MTAHLEDVKGFDDLASEVRDRGVCGHCGGCIAFCSAGEYNALKAEADGTPVWADRERCLKCGICYLICPQVKSLDGELRVKTGWKAPVGQVRSLSSARASSAAIRRLATDGGVVTALLAHALKKRTIDAAIVSRRVGPLIRQPAVATDLEGLLQAAGSHFEESLHVHAVGQLYSSYSPGIREMRALGEGKLRRIAIVGTPCQIFTMQKMRLLGVLPADSITLMIGLFCMENFSFGARARRTLEKRLSVKLPDIAKLNIKDDVQVTTMGRKTLHIPFDVMDEFARPACLACPDFANDYADIACGGLGSPEGWTTSLVRTATGERLFNTALRDGALEELSLHGPKARRDHYTGVMAKIVSFARRKQARAAARHREATRDA